MQPRTTTNNHTLLPTLGLGSTFLPAEIMKEIPIDLADGYTDVEAFDTGNTRDETRVAISPENNGPAMGSMQAEEDGDYEASSTLRGGVNGSISTSRRGSSVLNCLTMRDCVRSNRSKVSIFSPQEEDKGQVRDSRQSIHAIFRVLGFLGV